MALSIKDEETDRLVRRYARLHGTSYTGAIKLAVSNALVREGETADAGQDDRLQRVRQAVREAQRAYRALPTLDPRDHGEMLYDEDGIPK